MADRHIPVGDAEGDALRRARALSTPMRVAVLELLRDSPEPLSAQDLATSLGAHHTAVRQHLAVLCDAGFVTPVPQPPRGRGRPTVAYRALSDPDPYQRLAEILARAATDGLTTREAGRRYGSEVALSPGGGIASLQAEAERLGFRPTLRDRGQGRWEIVLHRCPFAEVATTSPDAVCSLHRGVAEGIAERVGGVEIIDLHPADPHRAGCRLVIAT